MLPFVLCARAFEYWLEKVVLNLTFDFLNGRVGAGQFCVVLLSRRAKKIATASGFEDSVYVDFLVCFVATGPFTSRSVHVVGCCTLYTLLCI